MPIPTVGSTDIGIDLVAQALSYSTGNTKYLWNDLYQTSDYSYQADAGSYHNLNMALPGLTDDFKTAIYNKWFATQNAGLKNWAGYNHDANVMLDMEIYNNSVDTITYQVSVEPTPGMLNPTYQVATGTLAPTQSTIANFLNTGLPAYSNFASGTYTYFINFLARDNTRFRCKMRVTTSSDTDAAGTGTTRDDYTSAGNPDWNLVIQGDFNMNLVAGNQWNVEGVSWNKRTSFKVDFF